MRGDVGAFISFIRYPLYSFGNACARRDRFEFWRREQCFETCSPEQKPSHLVPLRSPPLPPAFLRPPSLPSSLLPKNKGHACHVRTTGTSLACIIRHRRLLERMLGLRPKLTHTKALIGPSLGVSLQIQVACLVTVFMQL